MAHELSLDEVKVLRCAFEASDIDGDGYLSREDLQTSSGLTQSADVESLFNGFKRENPGDLISFEEFAKGVMDFPFLLEQYREELKERRSADGPIVNIDIIEEEDFPTKPRFQELESIREFPQVQTELRSQAMRQAYGFYSALLSHRSTLSWNGSPNEFRLENYVDMTMHLLEKLNSKYSRTPPDKVRDALLRGSLKTVEQLQDCLQALSTVSAASEAREAELSAVNHELERRCALSDSRANSLFDRLQALESEMLQEQSSRQEIQQETSHLQALLQSAHLQGQQTSQELRNIQEEIEAKEAEIGKLQQDLRRLTSRRVLREIAPAEESVTMEIRSIRRERKTAGGITAISYGKEAAISRNIASFQASSGQFASEKPRLSLFKDQQQRKTLLDLEYRLKCREIDLEAQFSSQLEGLKSKLKEADFRCKELETALKDQSPGPTYSTDPDERLNHCKLTLQSAVIAAIRPVKPPALKEERAGCCLSF